ncbi:hypothetical protein OIU77_003675 [Salix suchowensis]|uniref:THO COMPLEX SUBUNIT 6-like protein n=2 Tax=Salix TaxID=40685 RepID=A0A9Q0UML2_9ROSI|nr:hypothetical protein OIU77_003675 [Salix suchowensis]KAJ6732637.1 THO COMPLEX SUBUNIT 6-like protein [Salix koriyanagi]
MYGDATNWNEDAYKESILKDQEIQTLTVFRTAWPPSSNPNPNTIVLASSDGSLMSYSISEIPLGFSDLRAPQVKPNAFLQGHDGPAYDVKFYGNAEEDALLLSCGDDGRIRGWRWDEFVQSQVPGALQGNHIKPIVDLVNPQHKGPWGSLSPIPENNAIAVDTQGGSIFSAAGDSCAYWWDVETCKIKMCFKGHLDYLHCIVARNSANQIITGSEDGSARLWDCRSGKCIRVIDSLKDEKFKVLSSSVSCIALDASESWLACGSGRSLSVWNLSASECVSRMCTRASIQDVIFSDNQILAVGAEPVMSRFDINGAVLSQIPSAPQSAFSVSVHPSGVTAVGGYGGLVDIISQFGSHYCTFRCQCI